MPTTTRTGRRGLWLVAALLAGLLLRIFVVGAVRVGSVSMAPTLAAGEWLLVDKTASVSGLQRGELIVWRDGSGRLFVKRLVGLPGDRLEMAGERLALNGIPVARSQVAEVALDERGRPLVPGGFLAPHLLWRERLDGHEYGTLSRRGILPERGGAWTVEAGHLFVLGDNRDASLDSRHPTVGQVPLEQVEGRIWLRLRSAQTGRFFERIE